MFNEQIILLYSRRMTTRDIQAHLNEIYGVDISPELISRVIDADADFIIVSAPSNYDHETNFFDCSAVESDEANMTDAQTFVAMLQQGAIKTNIPVLFMDTTEIKNPQKF